MKKKQSLGQKVASHLRARESGKRAYKRAERLLEEILAEAKAGDVIQLPAGKKVRVMDRYADKNTVFRTHGIARYEIEVVEA